MSSNKAPINALTFLLMNSRLLANKKNSFIENFHERDTDLSVVIETWLMEDAGLLMDGSVKLELGERTGAIHCGRSGGRRGGCVGIFYRTSRMKVLDTTPKDNPHEIVVGLCTLRGTSRKVVCIGAYLTTALDVASVEAFLDPGICE